MMTNKKSLKRALILNVLSTLLCVSMLLGTTFAWFTDTVESGVNQIVAGNLDVEVEFSKDGQTWTDLAGATTLFQTDKWEPGTTDYVYFRVSNPGDLALKYQVAVYAASEVTSTSVTGATIKLSDLLHFGMTEASDTFTALADRDAARTAADANANGLALGAFSTANTLAPSATAYDYFSLVVYMPEDIGNEANYDKANGYAAPSIDLGVKLVATQVESESDSFDNTYDSGTTNDTTLTATTTTTASATGTTTLTVAVTPAATSNEGTSAEFAEGAFADGDTVKLTVSTSDLETTFTATSGDYVAAIDLSLLINGTEAETFNGKAVTITTYIAKGLSGVGVAYNGDGAQPAFVSYDPNTGKLVFTTTHFSEYAVTSTSAAYVKESDTAYNTLPAAIEAADAGNTVELLKSVALENVLQIGKSLTINGIGYEITNTANRVVRITQPNLDVKFYNTKLTSVCTATSDVRGISFDNASAGSSLLLDRCEVSASFYAINAVTGADNLTITVNNGTVAAGWAAFNLYSNNSTIKVTDSTLCGLNDKAESSWNNFNTITFDGNCLYKNVSSVGTAGSGNTMTITNSTIFASSNSTNNQAWIGIQYGAVNNTIVVDEATRIIDDNDENQSGNLRIGYYCNYSSSNWSYYANNSTITIGNSQISLLTEFDDSELTNVEYVIGIIE